MSCAGVMVGAVPGSADSSELLRRYRYSCDAPGQAITQPPTPPDPVSFDTSHLETAADGQEQLSRPVDR